MKVAEALREIKSIKGKLSRFWALYEQNIYYVDGEEPQFKVEELQQQIEHHTKALQEMKSKVSLANQNMKVDGISMAEILFLIGDLRGEVARRETIYRHKPANKYMRDERVIYRSVISDEEQVKKIEEIGAEIDRLDREVQKANWHYDLEALV